MAHVPSVGRSACKCSSRRRSLPRRSARARAAGVVRGAPLKAVVPAWRRDRVELSQCGAGGLLKARATMRVSRLRPRRSERSTVVVVAVGGCWRSRHSRLTASTRAGAGGSTYTGAGASAYILAPRYSAIVRFDYACYGYYDYVGWRSVFTVLFLRRSASRGLSCTPPGD